MINPVKSFLTHGPLILKEIYTNKFQFYPHPLSPYPHPLSPNPTPSLLTPTVPLCCLLPHFSLRRIHYLNA